MSTRQVIGRRREVSSKQERGVRRRKRLVESTRHFLESLDPQEISFKEIAKHADVPEGSAYHFFANKYDLFSAVAGEIGEVFVSEVAKPFASGEIKSWQDFLAQVIDRSAEIYRSDLVARKVLLGATMPHQVKNVDKETIEAYVATLESRYHAMFESPPVPELRQKLIYALTMVDAIFELDLSTNENLSDEVIAEAKTMMVSYLAAYIPEVVEMKQRG